MPSVGDTYVLMAFNNPGEKHHTGILVQSDPAMNSMWLTADGGQRDQMSQPKVVIDAQGRKDVECKPLSSSHEAAFIVGRLFGENTPGHGQLNNLHWFPAATTAFGWYIEGWLDITHPNVLCLRHR